jgi:hypothetical protein
MHPVNRITVYTDLNNYRSVTLGYKYEDGSGETFGNGVNLEAALEDLRRNISMRILEIDENGVYKPICVVNGMLAAYPDGPYEDISSNE